MIKYLITAILLFTLSASYTLKDTVIPYMLDSVWGTNKNAPKYTFDDMSVFFDVDLDYDVKLPSLNDELYNAKIKSLLEVRNNSFGQEVAQTFSMPTGEVFAGDIVGFSNKPYGLLWQGYDEEKNWNNYVKLTPTEANQNFIAMAPATGYVFEDEDGYNVYVYGIKPKGYDSDSITVAGAKFHQQWKELNSVLTSTRNLSDKDTDVSEVFKNPDYSHRLLLALMSSFRTIEEQQVIFKTKDGVSTDQYMEAEYFYKQLYKYYKNKTPNTAAEQASKGVFYAYSYSELANEIGLAPSSVYQISDTKSDGWDDNFKYALLEILSEEINDTIIKSNNISPLSLFGTGVGSFKGGSTVEDIKLLTDSYLSIPSLRNIYIAINEKDGNLSTAEWRRVIKFWLGETNSVKINYAFGSITLSRSDYPKATIAERIAIPMETVSIDFDEFDKFINDVDNNTKNSKVMIDMYASIGDTTTETLNSDLKEAVEHKSFNEYFVNAMQGNGRSVLRFTDVDGNQVTEKFMYTTKNFQLALSNYGVFRLYDDLLGMNVKLREVIYKEKQSYYFAPFMAFGSQAAIFSKELMEEVEKDMSVVYGHSSYLFPINNTEPAKERMTQGSKFSEGDNLFTSLKADDPIYLAVLKDTNGDELFTEVDYTKYSTYSYFNIYLKPPTGPNEYTKSDLYENVHKTVFNEVTLDRLTEYQPDSVTTDYTKILEMEDSLTSSEKENINKYGTSYKKFIGGTKSDEN